MVEAGYEEQQCSGSCARCAHAGKDPLAIARSLKLSAEVSQRRKSTAFRSAMSMLAFYVNRAGSQVPPDQRACLEVAKDELRVFFHRPRQGPVVRRKPRNLYVAQENIGWLGQGRRWVFMSHEAQSIVPANAQRTSGRRCSE